MYDINGTFEIQNKSEGPRTLTCADLAQFQISGLF